MQPDLLIAILTGLGAMLGWGFADFFIFGLKRSWNHDGNSYSWELLPKFAY